MHLPVFAGEFFQKCLNLKCLWLGIRMSAWDNLGVLLLTCGRMEQNMDQEIVNEDLEMYIDTLAEQELTWLASHKMGKDEAVSFYTKELAQAQILKQNLEDVLKATNKKIISLNTSFLKKLENDGIDLSATQVIFKTKDGVFTLVKENNIRVSNEDLLFSHLESLGLQELIKTKKSVHPMTLKKVYQEQLNETGVQLNGTEVTEWSRFKVKLNQKG